jgi:CheY-like chemotaxis protein
VPNETILIVDDRESNLLAMQAVLEDMPLRLAKATSGRDALKFLLQDECALIVLDVQMPDLDGFDTAKLIRNRERTKHTPIIFATAVHREEAQIIKGYSYGAVDYILKPFSPESLRAKVRVFVDQYRRERILREEAAQRARERDELQIRERMAHMAAESQSKQLHALFMKSPAAIAIVRGPQLVFDLANARYEELVGREDLVGKRGRDVLPEPEAQPTWDLVERVYNTGEPFLGNEYPGLWGRTEERNQRYFNFVAQPTRDETGAVDTVMIHAVEVTGSVLARRESEALARRLEGSDRSKDEFLAMLGHELRNPLAPILTALHVMRLRSQDSAAERERSVIERQVNHLSRLVDDLLDVSRATMGKIDLRRERLELADAVGRAMEQVRSLIQAKGHRLSVSVSESGLAVLGDQVRLAQVIANLMNNAAKYTEPGGTIEVEGRRELADVVLRVRDDGRGIPHERIASMFELFVQGDQPWDHSRGGLGVGLTLVRSLVQLHGGSVEARSEGPGRGSEFVVRLPAFDGPAPSAAGTSAAAGAAPGTAVRRVLVVDDNADNAEMLSHALLYAGHEVRAEHEGNAALATAARFLPDAVLLDLGLPGMDGFEVARRLRADPALAHIVIIALTGYAQESDRKRSSEAGIDHHLVKPVDVDAIIETIASVPARRPKA